MKPGTSIRLLRPVLALGSLRRRLALTLRLHHYDELEISLPLSHGLTCPLTHEDDRVSFSEIFIEGIYNGLLEAGPLPGRWLDLGCHAGYFSLWLEWQRRKANLPAGSSSALLLDADPRRLKGLNRLLELNDLGKNWRIAHGAIAAGGGSISFYERGFMGSSTTIEPEAEGRAVSVPILPPEKICDEFPPPYDLIKVDIEGAETDFLAHYGTVWQAARTVLLEWHSPHLGVGGPNALKERLRSAGFSKVENFGPSDPAGKFGHILATREARPH